MQTHLIIKKFFSVQLFIFISLMVFSQAFPVDKEKFSKVYSQEVGYTGEIRKNGKSMSREFSNFWETDSLTPDEKTQFINTANIMASKGCKGYPDFVAFADIMLNFNRKNIDKGQYDDYEKALIELLNDGKRPNLKNISEYLLRIDALLVNDIVSKTSRTLWKAENNSFLIDYDKEIIIIFDNINLVGYKGVDSLKIYKTGGIYYPMKNKWVGKDGIVGWERVRYGLDSIQAKLGHYNIDMRNMTYTADSVVFTNSMFFKQPMLGKLIDKAGNIDNPYKSNYPKFTSYNQHFELKDIVKGVDYEGGFSIHGSSFIGSGTKDEPARITITKNDTISLDAFSKAFYIDNKMIVTDNCAIILRLAKDSIFHPHLTFRFHNQIGLLELIRTKDGMSKVNFTNSYHQLTMDFTWMKWFIEKFKIDFTMIKTPGVPNEAMFESTDYYRLEKYKNIQKRDPQHPLVVITGFISSWAGYPEFYLDDLAKYMKYSPSQVVQMILSLAHEGYLSYDTETQYIKVFPEAWKMIEAHRGTKDSDVMQLYSKTEGNTANAELSLLNFDLKIDGIPSVHLSDSQNVKVFPIDRKINMKRNRSFTFNGTIQAGQFYFYGNNFKFDYNRFMIELVQCDSMKMVAETDYLDAEGKPKPAIVRNNLEHINGEFFIDEPMNKSGKQDFPEYPKFNSKDKTYVYYDRQDVFNRAYKRNKFYFEVEPFELDSIEGYSRSNLHFDGTLHSGGIFPPIKETLVLRKNDFSLGFNTHTPKEGLPLYEGKATYYNEIDLSNEGLRGVGKIDYLSSKINADFLIFFLNHMEGHSEEFAINQQKAPVEYPEVTGRDNTLRWNVEEDDFFIKKDTADFDMYENQGRFDGDLTLKQSGLYGKGILHITKAKLTSNLFHFSQDIVDADTANFDLYTINILNTDFESDNVNTKVDFTKRKGEFKTNGENTIWKFPKNKYISEMNQMTWYMDQEELAISADTDVLEKLEAAGDDISPNEWEDLFLEGPKFTSVHPRQDSLNFVAPMAKYNYKEHIIYAEGVKFIKVADATIYTDDGYITIEKDAIMRPISNAKIIANSTSRYHTIYNSVVSIFSKKGYTAYGDYDYLDNTRLPQTIHFNKIGVDASGQTYAKGDIIEPDNFKLSSFYDFQGAVSLYANQKNLEFNGGVRVRYECDTSAANWLKFKNFIDPDEIYIAVDSLPVNINNSRLTAGILLSNSNKIYPSFLGKKRNQYDQELFTAKGYLHYDTNEGRYMIASEEKLNEPSLPGNYLHIHRSICNVFGNGRVNFSKDFGLFKPNTIGDILYYPDRDTTEFELSMILDAHFNKDAMQNMADRLNTTQGLVGINPRDEIFEKALVEYLGTQIADEWFSNQSLGNYSKLPKELADKFVFTELLFIYYPELNSFIHYGPIGIANIGKNQVNKYVFGFIKFEKSRRGDVFEILLEPGAENYYYFRYNANTFSAISSDETFNQIVYDTKPGQRELKQDGLFYQYGLGSSTYMKRFKKEMYRKFNIDEDTE
ncbi:MAG: hypothetical protein PHW82_11575 [Bacteroidales bacterium]|nr:hypothetical protein [Bacteroidales bacterium]